MRLFSLSSYTTKLILYSTFLFLSAVAVLVSFLDILQRVVTREVEAGGNISAMNHMQHLLESSASLTVYTLCFSLILLIVFTIRLILLVTKKRHRTSN